MRDRRLRSDDRGATLIIVAAFMVVALVMAAAVIDLGNQRAEDKEVALSTDAAALAAVASIDFTSAAATGSPFCSDVPSTDPSWGSTVEDVVVHYLTVNGGSALESCRIFFDPGDSRSAYVTVKAAEVVDYQIGQAAGVDSGRVTATSSARIGANLADGVYPIGVCGPESPGPEDFIAPPYPQFFESPETVTLDFGNTNCGGSGNHDQINFVGGNGACPTNIEGKFTCDIIHGGFNGAIPPVVDSDTGAGGWNGQGLPAPLQELRDREAHIWVPVVGSCHNVPPPDQNCRGTGARYPVDYLMEVVIDTFEPKGPAAGFILDVYQVVDYAYYVANGLPLTTVDEPVKAHLCATGPDTSGCTINPT